MAFPWRFGQPPAPEDDEPSQPAWRAAEPPAPKPEPASPWSNPRTWPTPQEIAAGGAKNLVTNFPRFLREGSQAAGTTASNLWQSAQSAIPRGAPEQNAPVTNPATTPTPTQQYTSPVGPTVDEANAEEERVANLREQAAQTEYLQAQADKIRAELAQANSPEAKQLLQTQLTTAETNLTRAKEELERTRQQISPERQLYLADELARKREAIQAERAARERAEDRQYTLADRSEERRFQAGENASNRQFQLDIENRRDERAALERTENRELRIMELMMGREDREMDREMRRSEMESTNSWRQQSLALEKEKMGQDFQLRMLAHEVAKGELSAKKAIAKMQHAIDQRRAANEERQTQLEGYRTILPYATGAAEGSIPQGFGANGPMQQLVNMSGGSYNPSDYAIHPVSLNDLGSGKTYQQTTPIPSASGGAPAPAPSGAAPSSVPPMVQAATPSGAMPNGKDLARIKAAIGG